MVDESKDLLESGVLAQCSECEEASKLLRQRVSCTSCGLFINLKDGKYHVRLDDQTIHFEVKLGKPAGQ